MRLELYHGHGVHQPPPLPYQLDGEAVYEVSRVLDHRYGTRCSASRTTLDIIVD
jgi:hypothetical protein